MFVLWSRAKTPTGVVVTLASPATDSLGRAGFDGEIDTHFFERFGGALLLSIVADGSQIASRSSPTPTSRSARPKELAAPRPRSRPSIDQHRPYADQESGRARGNFRGARPRFFDRLRFASRRERRPRDRAYCPAGDQAVTANAAWPRSALATNGQKLTTTTPELRVLERYLEPLRSFLDDESLTEVVVNRPGEVFTEGPGGWTRHKRPALTYAHLINLGLAAAAVTHQDLGPEHPIVSTTLTRGERCQIVPPAVPAGTVSLTIRKASRVAMTLDDFERCDLFGEVRPSSEGLLPDEQDLLALRDAARWRTFLEHAVLSRRNIVISGATGSGKTTLAKGLVACIPASERILTIEDTPELEVPHTNHVRLLIPKTGKASPGLARGTPGIGAADAPGPYPASGAPGRLLSIARTASQAAMEDGSAVIALICACAARASMQALGPAPR